VTFTVDLSVAQLKDELVSKKLKEQSEYYNALIMNVNPPP
jgi:hypothetical protein